MLSEQLHQFDMLILDMNTKQIQQLHAALDKLDGAMNSDWSSPGFVDTERL